MKRTLALLLMAALLLVSCGSTAPETLPADTAPQTEAETTDPLAGIDFGGKTFRMSSSIDTFDSTNAHALIAGSGELNGEIVNDAVYQRNQTVMELLNIEMEFIEAEWNYNNLYQELEKLVLAGDCGFEVIVNDMQGLGKAIRSGYLRNVADTDILNLDAGYWYKEAILDLEVIPGNYYFLMGDAFTDCLSSVHVLYYNKDMITDVYGSGTHVQDMVLAGDWTVDRLQEIMADVAVDTDGDGALKEGDRMGFAMLGPWGPSIPILVGFSLDIYQRTDAGMVLTMNNERSVTALQELYELYAGDYSLNKLKDHTTAGLQNIFANQLTAFVCYLRLGDLAGMREYEFEVGLSPYPKLDEGQNTYISSMHNTTEIGAVVVTTPESEMDFLYTCIEAMGREAAKTVIPAYYEEALKVKYVNGAEDAAMIDLIHDNIASPSTLIFFDAALSGVFMGTIDSGKSDFASAYAAKASALEEDLAKMIADYAAIAGR
ncbi:MAG: hypothetical protein IKV57_10350 [Clostridia bacterium]|nr:hypothetical protein [Clostridia bacterium]